MKLAKQINFLPCILRKSALPSIVNGINIYSVAEVLIILSYLNLLVSSSTIHYFIK